MSDVTHSIPFPALTPAQRLHIEIYGYVIIENVLAQDEISALTDTLYGIEDDFRRTGELPGPNCFNTSTTENFFRIDNLPHLAPCFFDYLTKPFIVGIAEEIIGGRARLQQSDAHIRRRVPDEDQRYGFHRGINPAYEHYDKGLYHFSFIKALTNLTDLGPDDGGTTVIAGTHKVPTDIPQEAIISAALADPSMIHQVEAPAGSTLLFYESLVHAAGIIKSDKDRLLILGGYMPTMFQPWMDYDPDPDFAKIQSDEHRALLTGEQKFNWPRKHRDLGAPAETV
ncbi:MAG: ectoine hydroxylase-related dioxygenase (phytanoyl-CoA dioxygenase family) [Candidatus Latescibacterota bacterium]|jgi:ectoine hydroxylase-related dioxygenase (phytanoyl-CoA dioxygenase family)